MNVFVIALVLWGNAMIAYAFGDAAAEFGTPVDYPTLGYCETPPPFAHRRNVLNLLIDAKGWRHHLTKETTRDLDRYFNVYFGEAWKMMSCPISYWTHFDLVVSLHTKNFVRAFQTCKSCSFAPSLGISPGALSYGFADFFNRKADWRNWMLHHNLTNVVAKPVDKINPTFPCVVKTNVNQGTNRLSNGKDSDIMENKDQLNAFLKSSNIDAGTGFDEYTLEEPLQGMKNGRAIAYGSAHKGSILSLRCAAEKIQNFTDARTGKTLGGPLSPAKVSGGSSSSGSSSTPGHISSDAWKLVNSLGDEQVRGAGYRTYNPCGRIMVHNIHTFIHRAAFTGPFCINYRRDSKGQMIMLDMTPRICVSMMKHPELLVSSLVPLAYTIRTQDLPSLPPSHRVTPPRRPFPPAYQHEIEQIVSTERIMSEGKDCGDVQQGKQMGFKGSNNYVFSFFCDGTRKPASTVGGIILPITVAEASVFRVGHYVDESESEGMMGHSVSAAGKKQTETA